MSNPLNCFTGPALSRGRQTVAVLLLALVLPAVAAEMPAPMPVVVAESEAFEIVGRLDTAGLVLHVDRAPSNAPVLAATLEVESGGRSATAAFRPASGDYLIADAGWLEPLRQPGEHVLALTLIAGEDSDLLSGELLVAAAPAAIVVGGSGLPLALALGGLTLIGAVVVWRRRRPVSGGAA